MNLQNTWFYTTNLKNYPELQETLTGELERKFELKSQILSGNAGIGKTTQAVLLARDYCQSVESEQGTWHYSFEPSFVTFYEFKQILQDRQFGNEEQKAAAFYKLKDIRESPFLIFDDLRAERSSEYHQNLIDNALLDLLSEKFAARRTQTLIVTTNNTHKELTNHYSQAVCSRLFGMCEYIELEGEDKRLKNT